jgi:tetratricopeptide (TPR) repeat protein
MPRNAVRVFPVVLLIGLAIFVPLLFSGYSELKKASLSGSYAEAAQHYQNAALRIPWRGDLYELSGHNYYYAKEYVKADAAYRKAYSHNEFSAEGWVAGDVNYLNDKPERASKSGNRRSKVKTRPTIFTTACGDLSIQWRSLKSG